MRKILVSILVIAFLISVVSADIIINQQPNALYSLGDTVSFPVKIVAVQNLIGFLSVDVLCNGAENQIHKEFIDLKPGQEKQISASFPLVKSFTGSISGVCTIKASIGEDYALSNEFKISDKINVGLNAEKTEINPGEAILITGKAIKENSEGVKSGFVDLTLSSSPDNSQIQISDSVANGFFSLNFSFPKDAKAGEYTLLINVYEKDSEGAVSNKGEATQAIKIAQVPSSLEIAFENQEVQPGTSLKVKAILHDQSGEKINSYSVITIKKADDTILTQTEVETDFFLDYPIAYNFPPQELKIFAVSSKFTNQANCKIAEKQDAKITIINETLVIENIGNVQYDKEVLVKIGEQTIVVNASIPVDEKQEYVLTAPNGEYQVEISTDGEKRTEDKVALTGSAIDVKKVSGGFLAVIRHPIVWIFLIIVLAGVAYLFFKKGYKKAFFGYITSLKRKRESRPITKDFSIIKSTSPAEMSLSIKGNKQIASVVCLKLKNFRELFLNEDSSTKETLQKIVEFAEDKKAAIYQSQENIFVLLIPEKTKTFKNEMDAKEIADYAEDILKEHNKLFKQKINFGLAVNTGEVIAKQERNAMFFMSLGSFITKTKRLASISNEETFFSEEAHSKIAAEVKSERHTKEGVAFYKVHDVKHRADNKKFIGNFVKKLERENKEREEGR